MLHMEIIQERLEQEFNMTVITTVPNVSYTAYLTNGEVMDIHNLSEMPDPNHLDRIEEPYIRAQIITKAEFIGPIMTLCIGKRGNIVNQNYLTTDRVELQFDMPLAEIVFDFYDRLKTVSKGYASFDYHPIGMRTSKLVRLDVLLNAQNVDALSALIHEDNAYHMGDLQTQSSTNPINVPAIISCSAGDLFYRQRKVPYNDNYTLQAGPQSQDINSLLSITVPNSPLVTGTYTVQTQQIGRAHV